MRSPALPSLARSPPSETSCWPSLPRIAASGRERANAWAAFHAYFHSVSQKSLEDRVASLCAVVPSGSLHLASDSDNAARSFWRACGTSRAKGLDHEWWRSSGCRLRSLSHTSRSEPWFHDDGTGRIGPSLAAKAIEGVGNATDARRQRECTMLDWLLLGHAPRFVLLSSGIAATSRLSSFVTSARSRGSCDDLKRPPRLRGIGVCGVRTWCHLLSGYLGCGGNNKTALLLCVMNRWNAQMVGEFVPPPDPFSLATPLLLSLGTPAAKLRPTSKGAAQSLVEWPRGKCLRGACTLPALLPGAQSPCAGLSHQTCVDKFRLAFAD